MIIHGDCLGKLKELNDESIDSVVTDPPYGLKFMGKKWDHSVPSVEIWREVMRVLKPGGHLLSFGGTRTYHRMVAAIEDAGFEIRDQIQWLYGSGFPKSHNLPGGIGTALKPANEPIVLARKPIEGTVAANVQKYGTGGLNIDESRIGNDSLTYSMVSSMGPTGTFSGQGATRENGGLVDRGKKTVIGRWPANVLFDEEAAAMLDEQSGISVSRPHKNKTSGKSGAFNASDGEAFSPHNDSGGASRFFYVAKASKRERNAGLEGMPLVTARSGMGGKMPIDDDGHERDRFQATQANSHPTVKPIKLMEYLIKLITPHGGLVLDPFMGSGSTGVACKNLGFEFIGIEISEEYTRIAEKRMTQDHC